MDLNEFGRKADRVADKVGEEGNGVVDFLKANKGKVLMVLAAFAVIAIMFNV